MELRRKIEKEIRDWYCKENKALLIKGARHVGKTYVIRKTLKELGANVVEFNLIEKPEVVSILANSHTLDDMLLGLSTQTALPMVKGETVLFFDEIQKYKEMVTRIKFLVDEGSFQYVLSGSLLGVEITNLESAPVGYLSTKEMYPLDFEEFLQVANVNESILDHLKNSFAERVQINSAVHEKLLSLYRQYLVIGGMPEAVCRFAETQNLNEVVSVHMDIIEQYKLDFTQYEAENKRLILSDIYDIVPAELLKQNRRFIVSDLKKGLHFERVSSSFLWLKNAGVVHSVYNATEPRVPLKLNEKQSLFKLYLSDVGLLTTMYGMNTKAMILGSNANLNGGGLYENAVLCELVSKGYRVYYYNSNRLGELDFVIEYNGHILPIEVKSGKDYTVHSALNHVMSNPEFEIEEAFVFANCNLTKKGKLTYLPVYMSSFIDSNTPGEITMEKIEF